MTRPWSRMPGGTMLRVTGLFARFLSGFRRPRALTGASGNVPIPRHTPFSSQRRLASSSTPGPTEPYNRRKHYGNTPTAADRRKAGVGPNEVLDHDPPLVKRYYEGDPKIGEKPGHLMTHEERRASGSDPSRMHPQPRDESNAQGGEMAAYSRRKKKEHGL